MGTVLTYLCSLAFDGLINICPLTAQQRVTEHLLQDSFTGGDIYFKNILKYQIMPIVTTVTIIFLAVTIVLNGQVNTDMSGKSAMWEGESRNCHHSQPSKFIPAFLL